MMMMMTTIMSNGDNDIDNDGDACHDSDDYDGVYLSWQMWWDSCYSLGTAMVTMKRCRYGTDDYGDDDYYD